MKLFKFNNINIRVMNFKRVITAYAVVITVIACACVGNYLKEDLSDRNMHKSIDSLETVINNYKAYYKYAERLFDDVEEANDSFFETDNGADYLGARNVVIRYYDVSKDVDNTIK